MQRILWTSKSAMIAKQEKMDTISNNIANSQTPGYKSVEVSFQDLVGESLDRIGYPVSKNSAGKNTTGTGIKASDWVRDNTQGTLTETDQKGDLAIDGEGYFKLIGPNNQAVYSRAGNFSIDGNGRLADSNGNLLDIKYENGYNANNTKFTDDNYSVGENGDIFVNQNNETKKVGKIELYNAPGDNSFSSIGNNLYVPNSNAKVYKATDSSIRQGYVENSNVDMSSEMVDMIVTQRAFELASKGIKAADDMWGIANNLRSK